MDSGWASGTNRPPGRWTAAGRDGLIAVEDAGVHGRGAICLGLHHSDVGLVCGQSASEDLDRERI
jgi:hypothetical protein